MDQYYKASEAMKKLDLPRSTFFILVQTGQIPKIHLPLRKQALYPKEEIDKLAAERAMVLSKEAIQETKNLKLMVPSIEDFEQIVDIDRLLFPEETWITAKELQQRLLYNPKTTHILKNMKANIVLGYISMSPLKQNILEKLIKLEIDETSIRPEDFMPYVPNDPLDCYIVSMAARPGPNIAPKIYAGRLIYAMKDFILEALERGIIIRHIYTIAITEDGDRLAQGLDFQPLVLDHQWNSHYEDFRHVYILDLEDKASKSEIVREYQKQLVNRNRRKKRYMREK